MRAKTSELSAKTEAWLRANIPAFGQLRDQAIAAGLIEPTKHPDIQEISARVRQRLAEKGE